VLFCVPCATAPLVLVASAAFWEVPVLPVVIREVDLVDWPKEDEAALDGVEMLLPEVLPAEAR